MASYENYAIKNNVFGALSAPISSLATTIQLGDGQGQRFSVNQLATLENIENGKVMKREIVLITAINGDVLTVERKYAPCPANDDANTQGKVSYAFSTDDTISAYIDKEHFDEIDKSINDIYDNGVNKLRTEVVSGLQIKVNAGPILVGSGYYDFSGGTLTLTDDATNYIEIDQDGVLVSNTTSWGDKNAKISKVITSGGAIMSIEDWRLGTVGGEIGGVNIHELTEKFGASPNDELIISDSQNIWNTKKIKFLNFLAPFGDGRDGDCVITDNTRICAKEYNFNNLTICSGKILSFCGTGMPILRVLGKLCNLGTIDTYGGDMVTCCIQYFITNGKINSIKNTFSTITPTYSGGRGGCGATGNAGNMYCGRGGNGGTSGNNGGNGAQGALGGAGATCAGGGGGAGGNSSSGAGSNAVPCYGGHGGHANGNDSGGGGGGGYGYCKGGNGGNGGRYYASGYAGGEGGRGGDSYGTGGNGGNGGVSCFFSYSGYSIHVGRGGDGGNGYMGNGGNGGAGAYNICGCTTCCTGKGGNGGNSYRGNGGRGGNGVHAGNGGNTIFGNGGDGGTGSSNCGNNLGSGGYGRNGGVGNGPGACGGCALTAFYGLGVFAHDFYNTCICAHGGNGGNANATNGYGGDGADGGTVHVVYDCLLNLGCITVNGGAGGTGGCSNGQNGKDGELLVQRLYAV